MFNDKQKIENKILSIGAELDRLEAKPGVTLKERKATRLKMMRLIAHRISLRYELIAAIKAS